MRSQYYDFTEGEKMQRILLKLSGEALAGEKKHGFDEDTVRAVALQVKQLVDDGIQVGIVIGGGNFWRGRTSETIDRTKADQIGMLATVMNCIYVLLVLLFFPKQLPYCYLVISNVLVNFIPIVKSDGYYAVVTLFNKTNIKKDKVATTLEDAIRGIIMFGVLGIFSWLSQ